MPAAVEVAKLVPEGSNVVTVLADLAHKYADGIFQKMVSRKGLYDAIPPHLQKYAVLD